MSYNSSYSEPFEKVSIVSTSFVSLKLSNPDSRIAAVFANTRTQKYVLILILKMENILPSNHATGMFHFQVNCPLILMMLFILNPKKNFLEIL